MLILTFPVHSQVRKLVDEAMAQNNEELVKTENERDSILKEIGNLVPDDVPVSDNEVWLPLALWIYWGFVNYLIWSSDIFFYLLLFFFMFGCFFLFLCFSFFFPSFYFIFIFSWFFRFFFSFCSSPNFSFSFLSILLFSLYLFLSRITTLSWERSVKRPRKSIHTLTWYPWSEESIASVVQWPQVSSRLFLEIA